MDDEIQSLLKKYGIKPRKKFGQSFLKSTTIARDMVSAAGITSEDVVLEIGGGLGVLSKEIAQKAAYVYIIEIESGLVKALREVFENHENVGIIQGDALIVDLPEVTKIVSNLPYSISSEMTFRLLKELKFEQAVLMFQKEFALRLQAQAGSPDYSRLTVNIRYQADVEHLMDVPAAMFFPKPAVDSSIVRIRQRTHGRRARSDEVFYWMVNGIFSYPNKNIRKALGIWFRNLGVDKSLADIVTNDCHGSPKESDRLRMISVDSLITLADAVLTMIEENRLPDPRGGGI